VCTCSLYCKARQQAAAAAAGRWLRLPACWWQGLFQRVPRLSCSCGAALHRDTCSVGRPWQPRTASVTACLPTFMAGASPRNASRSARRAAQWSRCAAWPALLAATAAGCPSTPLRPGLFCQLLWIHRPLPQPVTCHHLQVGKLCIEVTPNDKIAWISEDLCIGCGICVKVRAPCGCCIRLLHRCNVLPDQLTHAEEEPAGSDRSGLSATCSDMAPSACRRSTAARM
jgi:hypothetical protein